MIKNNDNIGINWKEILTDIEKFLSKSFYILFRTTNKIKLIYLKWKYQDLTPTLNLWIEYFVIKFKYWQRHRIMHIHHIIIDTLYTPTSLKQICLQLINQHNRFCGCDENTMKQRYETIVCSSFIVNNVKKNEI